MFKSKKHTDDSVILFHEDKTVTIHPVIEVMSETTVETDRGIFDISDCKKYVDPSSGGVHYLFNVDLPVKAEASKLKDLRRSVALKRVFDFDKDKGMNIMTFIPYIITVIALIAK